MLEEQLTPPMSMFRHTPEDHCYHVRLLDEHQLVERQIIGKQAKDNVVATMVAEHLGFSDDQSVLY